MFVKAFRICPKCGEWKLGPETCSLCGIARIRSDITTEDLDSLPDEEFENKVKLFCQSLEPNIYDPELAKERRKIERKKSVLVYRPQVSCPYCQSHNVTKISNTSKAVHTAVFGVFSMSRNNKNFHCNNCTADF